MSKTKFFAVVVATAWVLSAGAAPGRAASLGYTGSDYDIGGTFFAGGTAPYVVVPWRSDTNAKPHDVDGNNVYGTDGYALFATQKTYPGGSTCCGGTQPFASATYPNMISLPSYVSGSLNLVANKVGGWPYALIDDPQLVNGYRDYNWGLSQVPPRPGPDQSPYVKLGIIDGTDTFGNNPKSAATGAGRWAFTVGAGVPNRLRVGVMTDGLDGTDFAASEVLLHQIGAGNSIIGTATSGTVTRNRFVDIHTFDVIGAQPGDTFAVFAKAPQDGFGQGAISGVTFDAVPEPASAAVGAIALAVCGCLFRGRKH